MSVARTGSQANQGRPLVVIDIRERMPYSFPSTVTRTLPTGDYSIYGLEDRIAIERKTKADAYKSLGYERARFQREMERLAWFDYAAVVIEASLTDFLVAPPYCRLNPKSAICSLLAWSVRYGVHVYFAGNRGWGNFVTETLLKRFWLEYGG